MVNYLWLTLVRMQDSVSATDKRDYFISVLNSLSSISSGKYREYSYIDKRTNKTYKSLNFLSKALPKLNEFYTKFYNGKVKIVPSELSLLTPLALAVYARRMA